MKTVFNKIANYFRTTDIAIWILSISISCFSLVLLQGVLNSGYKDILRISNRNLYTQAISIIIGVFLAYIISLFDYREIAKKWILYIPLCYILIVLTFFIGVGAQGRPEDKRWLYISAISFSFQPAELLRITFILVFAYHIDFVKEDINAPKQLAGLIAHAALPVILLHLQGDDGSALIFAVIVIFMLFCSGISWKYIVGCVIIICALIPILWFFVLDNFQKQRILSLYFDKTQDVQGYMYQQSRALIAIGSGELNGKGVSSPLHTYVPEMHNDFIFSFLGECFGFIGCLLVIVALITLWVRIIICAYKSKDLIGSLICIGIFAMFSFQTIINIGMNISILPVIGNTLPFLSYGGSSMLTSFLGIGLILSVSMHSPKTMFH